MERSDELLIEIDGADVSPETVDAVRLLELGLSYLRLLERVSGEDAPLRFSGLAVRDKCVALVTHPGDQAQARSCAVIADEYIRETVQAPAGLTGAVRSVREVVSELGAGLRARVVGADWDLAIDVREDTRAAAPFETISLRARLIRAGGIEPTAQFESDSETEPFTLRVKRDLARSLARHLYDEIDIEAVVARDRKGRIERGNVVDFSPLDEGDEDELWRSFHREAGSDWDDIDDVEGELGRGLALHG